MQQKLNRFGATHQIARGIKDADGAGTKTSSGGSLERILLSVSWRGATLWTADVAGDGRGARLSGLKGTQVTLHVSLRRRGEKNALYRGKGGATRVHLGCSVHPHTHRDALRVAVAAPGASRRLSSLSGPKWAHSNGNQQSSGERRRVFWIRHKGQVKYAPMKYSRAQAIHCPAFPPCSTQTTASRLSMAVIRSRLKLLRNRHAVTQLILTSSLDWYGPCIGLFMHFIISHAYFVRQLWSENI